MLDLDRLLRVAVDQRASDVHLKVGARPHLRVDGELVETTLDVLEPADTAAAAKALLGEASASLAAGREVDSVHAVAGLGRFRVGAFLQRGRVGLVLRRVVPGVPSIEALGLPPIATTLAGQPSGFVLVTGLAGSGRTSTLAALVDAVNATRRCHILTIESPVEVVHDDKLAVVDQREVGTDTESALAALRSAAHQDPDVLAVGDLDDADTALAALESADAGHLVLGVTQAVSAPDAVTRLIDRFAADERAAVHALLARSLRGVLCQRLVPRAGGRGRVPAVEVLTVNALVAEALADGASSDRLCALMADGDFYGMQSFDQSLAGLYRRGLVTREDALAQATYEPGLAVLLDEVDRARPVEPPSPSPSPSASPATVTPG